MLSLSFPLTTHSRHPPAGGVLPLFRIAPLPVLAHLSEHLQTSESRHHAAVLDSVCFSVFLQLFLINSNGL